MKRHTI